MIIEKAQKGYRAQKPLYRSVADFMLLVQNHPELQRDANFPSSEDEVDYIPSDRIEELEHLSSFFTNNKGVNTPDNEGSCIDDDGEGGAKRSDVTTEPEESTRSLNT